METSEAQPNTGTWCHRALTAEWLAEALGQAVPEVGFDTRPQADHPLMAAELQAMRTPISAR